MAFTTDGADDVAPQMNVTPLVDVVLVLLIIFMIITPFLAKTFWIHMPIQQKEEVEKDAADQPVPPLVLHVAGDGTLQINASPISADELPERLGRMFAARTDHVLFLDADDGANYGFVVQVLDRAREGGAVTIGVLTTPLDQPPGSAQSGS